mgnify:CR=1 FL=1
MSKHCTVCGPVDQTTTQVTENGRKLTLCDKCFAEWSKRTGHAKHFGEQLLLEG